MALPVNPGSIPITIAEALALIEARRNVKMAIELEAARFPNGLSPLKHHHDHRSR
jgi:hypothetical protein